MNKAIYEARNQARDLCYAIEEKLPASKEATMASNLSQELQSFYDESLRADNEWRKVSLDVIADLSKASLAPDMLTGIINLLCERARKTAIDHGFQNATIGEEIALMHSELSEALEDYREGKPVTQMRYFSKEDGAISDTFAPNWKPTGIPFEMADVVIRVFDFCGKHGVNLGKAIIEKMAYNETRPYKHGGKKL